jgi:hypothetical protein
MEKGMQFEKDMEYLQTQVLQTREQIDNLN